MLVDAANPSNPSVKLTALENPAIQMIVNNANKIILFTSPKIGR